MTIGELKNILPKYPGFEVCLFSSYTNQSEELTEWVGETDELV